MGAKWVFDLSFAISYFCPSLFPPPNTGFPSGDPSDTSLSSSSWNDERDIMSSPPHNAVHSGSTESQRLLKTNMKQSDYNWPSSWSPRGSCSAVCLAASARSSFPNCTALKWTSWEIYPRWWCSTVDRPSPWLGPWLLAVQQVQDTFPNSHSYKNYMIRYSKRPQANLDHVCIWVCVYVPEQ